MCHVDKQCQKGEIFILWTLELILEKKKSREENTNLCASPACTMLALSGVEEKSWGSGKPAPIRAVFLVPY